MREKAFALDALSSDLRPLGFEESKRADDADEESVAEDSVKFEDIEEWAYDADEVEEAETQSPDDLGVGVGRPVLGELLRGGLDP